MLHKPPRAQHQELIAVHDGVDPVRDDLQTTPSSGMARSVLAMWGACQIATGQTPCQVKACNRQCNNNA